MRLLITAARRIHKRPLCSSTSCISSAASCSGAATKSGLQFRDDQLICGSTRELVQRLRGQVDVRMEFISEEEEGALIKELEPGLRKKIYEFDHWDDPIHGYRETEYARWGAVCEGGMDRLRAVAFSEGSPLLGPCAYPGPGQGWIHQTTHRQCQVLWQLYSRAEFVVRQCDALGEGG
ncbi:hypothetical protein J4Q44_G00178100 [Coregonus suidteri]|uniref:Uncharacterized protein n=1 Tax=Coregonus suidteri TaxID=861788 RepID=A0AAN8LWH3_9TELE